MGPAVLSGMRGPALRGDPPQAILCPGGAQGAEACWNTHVFLNIPGNMWYASRRSEKICKVIQNELEKLCKMILE